MSSKPGDFLKTASLGGVLAAAGEMKFNFA